MIFAVFDLSLLTVCITYINIHLIYGSLEFVRDYLGEPVPEAIWIVLKQETVSSSSISVHKLQFFTYVFAVVVVVVVVVVAVVVVAVAVITIFELTYFVTLYVVTAIFEKLTQNRGIKRISIYIKLLEIQTLWR